MFIEKKCLIGLAVMIFCAGCVSHSSRHLRKVAHRLEKRSPDQSEYFDSDKAVAQQKQDEPFTGSLWTDSYQARLYDNMYRASRIGDSVMIVISEESEAEGTGDTRSDKKLDQSNSISTLGGLMAKLQGVLSGLSPTNLISAKSDSKFQGKASTERTGKLFAQISATVTDVLKNGNMAVRGEKRINVNKEEQILIVEGIIRPYDILPDNTVLSKSLADARITYSGFGIIADRQSPGWLVRALDHIWPF